jgi:hypothetical protein
MSLIVSKARTNRPTSSEFGAGGVPITHVPLDP